MNPITWQQPRAITGAVFSEDLRWMLYPMSDGQAWWATRYEEEATQEQTTHPDEAAARAWCEQRARELATTNPNQQEQP